MISGTKLISGKTGLQILAFLIYLSNLWITASCQTNQTFQPPVFTDADRMKKIEAVFPVIEKIYKAHAEKNHFPGMSFGLVVDGRLVFSGSTGFTDVNKKIPATTKSMFRIASMSKSFTSMAILKLRDEGKLNLDDPAYKYIPELKNLKYPTGDAPPITIRHLMTHGAGFPEDNPWGDRQLADTDKELMDFLRSKHLFQILPVLHMNTATLVLLCWERSLQRYRASATRIISGKISGNRWV